MIAVLIIFVCGAFVLFTYIFQPDAFRQVSVWITSRHVPEAEAKFNQLQSILPLVENDTLFIDFVRSPKVTEARPWCISAVMRRIYGTRRLYNDVLKDYEAIFGADEWLRVQIDDPSAASSRAIWRLPNAEMELEHLNPTQRPMNSLINWDQIDWQAYETIYYIELSLVEPSLNSCVG